MFKVSLLLTVVYFKRQSREVWFMIHSQHNSAGAQLGREIVQFTLKLPEVINI